MRGGLSFNEEQGYQALDRLERASDKRTVAKLPCCGSGVEITEPGRDTFVVCPNANCRKRHVVVGDRRHEIKSEEKPDGGLDFTW